MKHKIAEDSPFCRIQNLGFKRHPRFLFQNLDFELACGQIWQILGENGAGKTHLLKLLAGILSPTTGKIAFQADFSHADCHWIGHLPAHKAELSVFENLQFYQQIYGTPAHSIQNALQTVGLAHKRHALARELSQGQNKRLSLARLFLYARPLWILDEPLASLDVASQAEFAAHFASHAAQGGMVVLSSHQPLTDIITHTLNVSDFTPKKNKI